MKNNILELIEQNDTKAIEKLIAERVAISLENNKGETVLDATIKETTKLLNLAIKEMFEEREEELRKKFEEKQKELEKKERELQKKERELQEKEDELRQIDANNKKISENVEIGTFIEKTYPDGRKEFTLRAGKIMPCTEEEVRIYGVAMKLDGERGEVFKILEITSFEGRIFYMIQTSYWVAPQQYFQNLDMAKKYLIEKAKKEKLL
jgi:hypothetical protein